MPWWLLVQPHCDWSLPAKYVKWTDAMSSSSGCGEKGFAPPVS